MESRDIFRYINEQDESTLNRIVERMEFRGRDPTFRAWMEEYIRALVIPDEGELLAIGCGTGVEVRRLAERPGFTGRITGLDTSPFLIDAARDFAAQAGIDGRTVFVTGDVHKLTFDDDRFDAVIAHTLISHVSNPLKVLQEAARVVKPGGTVVIFDGDYASWSFGCSDPVLGKTMEEAIISSVVHNPRIMRMLPRLIPQAGLQLISSTPHHFAEIGKGSFFLSAAEAYGPLPEKQGLLPGDAVRTWLEEQRRNHAEGVFFGAGNYYTYFARK